MVQIDLTVRISGGQEDAQRVRRWDEGGDGRIARYREPIGRCVGLTAALQEALALVVAAGADLAVVCQTVSGTSIPGGRYDRRPGGSAARCASFRQRCWHARRPPRRRRARWPGTGLPGDEGEGQQHEQVRPLGAEEGAVRPSPAQRGQGVALQAGAHLSCTRCHTQHLYDIHHTIGAGGLNSSEYHRHRLDVVVNHCGGNWSSI